MGWRVLANILGEEFVADALPVCGARGAAAVEGFAGLPTLHQPNGLAQYLVVNSRPVRDKLLAGAGRAAATSCPTGAIRCSRCS